jgi:hypothetical protein
MNKLQIFKLENEQWILVKEVPHTAGALDAEVALLPTDGEYRIELRQEFQSIVLYPA